MVWTGGIINGRRCQLAPSLVALVDQADELWPNRSTASDGSIGDAAHAARVSDHNPDASGDVLAVDLTDDKWAGCDADAFAEHLRQTRDHRIKYVICNGRVFRSYGSSAWQWTPYTGINGHFAHTHVSILDTTAAKNDTSSWFDTPAPQPEDDMTPEQEALLRDVRAAVANVESRLTQFQSDAYANFLLIRQGVADIDTGEVDVETLAALLADDLGDDIARQLGEALVRGAG